MSRISVHLLPDQEADGEWVRSAEVRTPGKDPRLLVFRVPVEHRDLVTESADPFLLLALFPAMEAGLPLCLDGVVSRDLLGGLDEFQSAWAYWWPHSFKKVRIEATSVARPTNPEGVGALACFSGGVDSTFTIWRHHFGNPDRGSLSIGAGMFARGFDIPLDRDDDWNRALESVRKSLGTLGLPLIPVTCNIREFGGYWPMTHGAALGACLHLLRRGFSEGVIAATHVYNRLRIPWGTNPVTDPLLSTRSFRILNDGTGFTRAEKCTLLSTWPGALKHLLPCWKGPDYAANCGRCYNCITTGMSWIAAGEEPPEVLNLADLPERIARIPEEEFSPMIAERVRLVWLDPARERGIRHPALDALEKRVDRALRRFERRDMVACFRSGSRKLLWQALGRRPRTG